VVGWLATTQQIGYVESKLVAKCAPAELDARAGERQQPELKHSIAKPDYLATATHSPTDDRALSRPISTAAIRANAALGPFLGISTAVRTAKLLPLLQPTNDVELDCFSCDNGRYRHSSLAEHAYVSDCKPAKSDATTCISQKTASTYGRSHPGLSQKHRTSPTTTITPIPTTTAVLRRRTATTPPTYDRIRPIPAVSGVVAVLGSTWEYG